MAKHEEKTTNFVPLPFAKIQNALQSRKGKQFTPNIQKVQIIKIRR